MNVWSILSDALSDPWFSVFLCSGMLIAAVLVRILRSTGVRCIP